MKNLIKSTICALATAAVLGFATNAGALAVGDSNYLGKIVDGIPAGSSLEVSYINYLNDLAPGAGDIVLPGPGGETYNRIGSTVAGPFPEAVEAGGVKDETAPYALDATGFLYVLGKYGNAGLLVWYFPEGATGVVTLPANIPGTTSDGLSHISAYNPTTTRVPDGGATALLLGMGLTALAFVNRKLR